MLTALAAEAKTSLRNILRTAAPSLLSSRIQNKWDHEREFHLLPALCDSHRTSIDVGANWGQYTGALRDYSASVIAFEPVPPLARFLSRAWRDRVRVEQIALSNVNGNAEFVVESDWSWSALDDSGSANGRQRLPVTLRTMDSVVEGLVGFIKIDVEGHEEEVIEGARGVIARNHPAMVVEIEERHRPGALARVEEGLSAEGYSGFFLQGHSMRPISEFTVTEHQNPLNYPYNTSDPKYHRYFNNFVFIHGSFLPEKKKRLAQIGFLVA